SDARRLRAARIQSRSPRGCACRLAGRTVRRRTRRSCCDPTRSITCGVIVPTYDLAGYAGKVTMVDGGVDPLHHGHVAYFQAAAGLGLPVLCNVAPDDWVRRKHPPLLPQAER